MDWSFLQLPVWLVALGFVALATVRGTLWIKSAKLNGHSGPSPVSAEQLAVVVETRTVLQGVATQLTTVGTVLNDTALVLTKVAERLDHLPTKADVAEDFKETRHMVRDVLNGVSTTLQAEVSEVGESIKEARVDVGATAARLEDEIKTGVQRLEGQIAQLPQRGRR